MTDHEVTDMPTLDPADVGLASTTVVDEAVRVIDEALAQMMQRELVSSSEVADLLLDLRMLLTADD